MFASRLSNSILAEAPDSFCGSTGYNTLLLAFGIRRIKYHTSHPPYLSFLPVLFYVTHPPLAIPSNALSLYPPWPAEDWRKAAAMAFLRDRMVLPLGEPLYPTQTSAILHDRRLCWHRRCCANPQLCPTRRAHLQVNLCGKGVWRSRRNKSWTLRSRCGG